MNSLEVRHWRSNIFFYIITTLGLLRIIIIIFSYHEYFFLKRLKNQFFWHHQGVLKADSMSKEISHHSLRNDLVKCFKIFHIFGIGTPKYILHMVLASIWGKNELARNEKKDLGFCILKIWQNLNHFTRSFPHA